MRVAPVVSLVRLLAVTVVVLASLACGVVSAEAATGFRYGGAFSESGPDGELHHQQRLAVHHATGLLFRANVVTDEVKVSRTDGSGTTDLASFGLGELSDPFGVAVDQATGDVYVSDAGNDRVVRYLSDGLPDPTYTRDLTYAGPVAGVGVGEVSSFRAAIAVDPSTGKLLLADPGSNSVKRFAADGSYDSLTFDAAGSPGGVFTGLQDLAVDSTGDVIVVDGVPTGDPASVDPASGAAGRVERFSATGAWEATVGPVDNAANVAVRPYDDKVVVAGNQDAVNDGEPMYPTLYVFNADGSGGLEIALRGTEAFSTAYSTVSGLAVAGGADGRLYVSTDTSRGSYPAGYGLVSVQTYAYIPPAPPTVTGPAAAQVTAASARLTATVNAGNTATFWRFEYGTTSGYGQSTPTRTTVDDDIDRQVNTTVSGLQPATTYHYRVVVDNGIGGPVVSDDQTFTTADAPPTPTVGAVTNVTNTTATITGTVDTHALTGAARLTVIQTDGGHSQSLGPIQLAATDGPQQLSATATGLAPGGSYIARITATTSAGERSSDPVAFTTTAPAGYQPPAPPQETDDWPNTFPTATPPVEPSNRFTARSTTQGTRATITISIPGPGTLRATGGKRLTTTVKRSGRKGNTALRLKLTKTGRKALRKSKTGRLKVAVTLRYTPTAGTPRTVTRTLTFKRKASQ